MKKIGMVLALFSLSLGVHAKAARFVFVSFSMPKTLLNQTFERAAEEDVTVVLNGLINDDFKATLATIFQLSKAHANLAIQIDPIAFEKYGIRAVPALVVDDGQTFDVLYGNMALSDGLAQIQSKGALKGRVL